MLIPVASCFYKNKSVAGSAKGAVADGEKGVVAAGAKGEVPVKQQAFRGTVDNGVAHTAKAVSHVPRK